jgi:hypothetical protein
VGNEDAALAVDHGGHVFGAKDRLPAFGFGIAHGTPFEQPARGEFEHAPDAQAEPFGGDFFTYVFGRGRSYRRSFAICWF